MNGITPYILFYIFIIITLIMRLFIPLFVISAPYNLFGIVFIFIGVCLNIILNILFRKYKTTVSIEKRPNHLVTEGPFRYSRNPGYLGLVFILMGFGVALGSLFSIALSLIFLLILDILYIRNEEKMLLNKFGFEYYNYMKNVRRWL